MSFGRLRFVNLMAAVLVVSSVVGIVGYGEFGTVRNTGSTGAIAAENATIVAAEHTSCHRYGAYATLASLEKEGLLTIKPTYNSIVIVPGKHCGTVVVGSTAYQAPAG